MMQHLEGFMNIEDKPIQFDTKDDLYTEYVIRLQLADNSWYTTNYNE
jgi:hypothetical protein